MKKHIFAACIAALGVAPAAAADMAFKAAPAAIARPIYDWTGLYLGINGGGGQSHNCWDLNGANVPVYGGPVPGGSAFIGVSGAFNPALSEGCNNGTGAVAGGQIGYRYMVNSFVFGIEAQGDWANLKGSNTSSIFNKINAAITPASINLTNTSKVDAIGMFTGQIGYSFGPLLWYVKGGAAVTNNQYDGALSLNVPAGEENQAFGLTATDHASAVRFGGVVGTGLDYMFAPGWSVGAEYNHLFMGSREVGLAYTGAAGTGAWSGLINSPAGVPSRHETISQDIDMATVRLNYNFGAR
jgi:outer membrane immunogenic protein